jgi:hypothetical protein
VFRQYFFQENSGVSGMGHADSIAHFMGNIGYSGVRGGDAAVHGCYDLLIIRQIGYPDAGIEGHTGVGNVQAVFCGVV